MLVSQSTLLLCYSFPGRPLRASNSLCRPPSPASTNLLRQSTPRSEDLPLSCMKTEAISRSRPQGGDSQATAAQRGSPNTHCDPPAAQGSAYDHFANQKKVKDVGEQHMQSQEAIQVADATQRGGQVTQQVTGRARCKARAHAFSAPGLSQDLSKGYLLLLELGAPHPGRLVHVSTPQELVVVPRSTQACPQFPLSCSQAALEVLPPNTKVVGSTPILGRMWGTRGTPGLDRA